MVSLSRQGDVIVGWTLGLEIVASVGRASLGCLNHLFTIALELSQSNHRWPEGENSQKSDEPMWATDLGLRLTLTIDRKDAERVLHLS